MNDPTLEDLAVRLARLERVNQRWRRLATAAFLGLTVVLLTGQVRSRPARASMTLDDSDPPRLSVLDAKGALLVQFPLVPPR